MTSSIEAVLFDFGGVFTGSPFQAIDKYAAAFLGWRPLLVDARTEI